MLKNIIQTNIRLRCQSTMRYNVHIVSRYLSDTRGLININTNQIKSPNISNIESEIQKVKLAQKEYSKFNQKQVDYIFEKAAMSACMSRIPLAKLAVAETKMGLIEDKTIKNHFASEYIYNHYKNTNHYN